VKYRVAGVMVLGLVAIGLAVPTAAVASTRADTAASATQVGTIAQWPPPCGFSRGDYYRHCGFNRVAILVQSRYEGTYEMCVDVGSITGWRYDSIIDARVIRLC